jgi:hypothetical protein
MGIIERVKMNNEMPPKQKENTLNEDSSINEWNVLMSSDSAREERYAKTKQAIAELKAEFPTTEIEKKTLDKEYHDFLGKIAERDNVDYDVIYNGDNILLKYGNDSVLMDKYSSARVGERGPISFYLVVSPEDAAKPWFQEMIDAVGGDVRTSTPKLPPNSNE